MVGTKATKAIITPAIEAIRSCKLLIWKNIPKLMILNNQRGKKIVIKGTKGYLYRGMLK
jgi:hypothetical protein